MSADNAPSLKPGAGGHRLRELVVNCADANFRNAGYSKTSVSNIAKEIGVSKAYVYKFFKSKQAIADIICARDYTAMLDFATEEQKAKATATARFRRFIRSLSEQNQTRRLTAGYDLLALSARNTWPSYESYDAQIGLFLRSVIVEGRAAGEFERSVPLTDVVRGINLAFGSFYNPSLVQLNADDDVFEAVEVSNLVLRSLAP